MLTVSELPGFSLRLAMAFAKATFNIAGGRAVLETQAPKKLLLADTPTPLGDLPRDDLPRSDSVFEVVLLGQARAAGGAPCRRMQVSMSVGGTRRDLIVTGDRHWEMRGRSGGAPSDPEPFAAMPLSLAQGRSGGSCAMEIDHESFVDLCDVRNAAGRGWGSCDGRGRAGQTAEVAGRVYRSSIPTRLLPNVSNPEPDRGVGGLPGAGLLGTGAHHLVVARPADDPGRSGRAAGWSGHLSPCASGLGASRGTEADALVEVEGVTERGAVGLPAAAAGRARRPAEATAPRGRWRSRRSCCCCCQKSLAAVWSIAAGLEIASPDGEPRQARLRRRRELGRRPAMKIKVNVIIRFLRRRAHALPAGAAC